MSGLLGSGGKTNAAAAPNYTQMQLQSSVYGIAVPIVYGTTRISWNLGDYVNFRQHQQKSSGGKGGAVGGGGKGGGQTSVTYSASVIGFLGEGPISGVASCWISQTQSPGTPGFTIFDGALAQAPWTYFEDNFPTHALSYSGLAYAAAQDYDLGTSANLPNVGWEVQGIFQNTAPGTYGGGGCVAGGDADPSLVVPDILTNPQYGLGFPVNQVGQVSNWNEPQTVPASGPFTVAVTLAAFYLFNVNVARADGALFTCVSGTPTGSLEYAYDETTGIYTFSAAAAGASVLIRYATIAQLTDYQSFCLAAGLWISPAYTSQAAASSMLDDIALATFSEFVWSSGVLTLVPRASQEVSGNGHSYTPPSSPLFSLGPDDFLENTAPIGSSNSSGGDPVLVSRSRVSDQINAIKIEAFDRKNQYAPAVVEATDQALIDVYGRRQDSSKSLHMFCDLNAAYTSAHLQLQDQYIRNSYSFQLDERYCLLDPMDVVELTDPEFPGLTNIPVRILEMQENDDGSISFAAEEYPGSIGVVPSFNIDGASGLVQDFNVDPGDAATPAIFDVPVQLAEKLGLETWLATHSATGNPNWGGCEIWISSDDTTYAHAGEIVGASRMGTLTAGLASGSDPDTSHTLAVDLSESLGELEAGTHADADNGDTICFVDGEYISYSDVSLTSTFHYSMANYLRRGQWGSQIGAHLTGALFVRLDNNVFRLPYNATDKGRTIYIKLLSFNIYRAARQNLSDVSSFSHVIGGPPTIYAPTSLTVIPTLKGNQLTWVNAPNVGIAAVEIWRSATSSFGSATKIADAAAYATAYLDQNGTASATQYWYWIRCRDIAGNEGGFDPLSTGAGAHGTTLQAQTADIADSAITAPKIAPGAITALAFAAGIRPVFVVSSLPGTATEGDTAVLTTDGKLYRYHSGAWTTVVPTVDLSGVITQAQIASGAIDLSKVASGLTFVQIVSSLPSGSEGMTVLLTTDGKLYRFHSGSWTRATDGADIIANSITAGQIASGTITGALIAGGTITGSLIAANTITAGNLAANSVTSASVAANAITAGTIAVGAVNATAIIVNDIIVTGHLVANAISDASVAVGGTTPISTPFGAAWTTLTSVTKSLTGTGDVQLFFTSYITWNTNGPRGFYRIIDNSGTEWMRVGYGGGSCPDFINSSGTGLDTSGQSGSVTYYLQADWEAGSMPTANLPALMVTELKK